VAANLTEQFGAVLSRRMVSRPVAGAPLVAH
jgi:hypothetical protein